jgi:hypothetical protein
MSLARRVVIPEFARVVALVGGGVAAVVVARHSLRPE